MEQKRKGFKGFVVLEVLAIIAAIHIAGAAVTGVVFWEIGKKKEVAVQQSEKSENKEIKNDRDSEK